MRMSCTYYTNLTTCNILFIRKCLCNEYNSTGDHNVTFEAVNIYYALHNCSDRGKWLTHFLGYTMEEKNRSLSLSLHVNILSFQVKIETLWFQITSCNCIMYRTFSWVLVLALCRKENGFGTVLNNFNNVQTSVILGLKNLHYTSASMCHKHVVRKQ